MSEVHACGGFGVSSSGLGTCWTEDLVGNSGRPGHVLICWVSFASGPFGGGGCLRGPRNLDAQRGLLVRGVWGPDGTRRSPSSLCPLRGPGALRAPRRQIVSQCVKGDGVQCRLVGSMAVMWVPWWPPQGSVVHFAK